MAHLLPYPESPAPPLPPPRSINASPKSALLVENDESLLSFLRRSLEDEGYAVRTAANSEEGLRLYRDCGPFNVVLIDYCVPPSDGVGIDYLAPLQKHGIGLAMAIRQIHPSQGIIIAALAYRNAARSATAAGIDAHPSSNRHQQFSVAQFAGENRGRSSYRSLNLFRVAATPAIRRLPGSGSRAGCSWQDRRRPASGSPDADIDRGGGRPEGQTLEQGCRFRVAPHWGHAEHF